MAAPSRSAGGGPDARRSAPATVTPRSATRRLAARAARPRWAARRCSACSPAPRVLYLWGLGASGWANSFYSAAAQAGGAELEGVLLRLLDAANSITVDKPPASLWVMGLSVRLFGLSSWSILVPQALMGVASVGVLYATVRRWFGAGRGPDRGRGAGADARSRR